MFFLLLKKLEWETLENDLQRRRRLADDCDPATRRRNFNT